MKYDKNEKIFIIVIVLLCSLLMGFIETVIEPTYFIKSLMKIILFLIFPLFVMKLLKIKVSSNNRLKKNEIIKLFVLGIFIYFVIMASYFITKNIFDYKELVLSLSSDQKVSSSNFIYIALYISFCNSFLEEFLFRFLAFIKLSKYIKKRYAYLFSSFMFAIYHIAMVGSSFPFPLLIISILGLAAGGYVFDYIDEKNDNIYNSWFVHMFADFAIMTIWFINI